MDYNSVSHNSWDNSFNVLTISSNSSQTFTINTTNTITTITNFKTTTINCCGLRKSGDPSVRNHFIHCLRTHSFDILAPRNI